MSEILDSSQAHLFVASREGILAIQLDQGEPQVLPWALYGQHVLCLATDDKGVLLAAGTRDGKVRVSADGRKEWTESRGYAGAEPRVLVASGRTLHVGSAPAAVHRSEDAGRTFRAHSLEGPWRAGWTAPEGEGAPRVAALLPVEGGMAIGVRDGGVLLVQGEAARAASEGLPPGVLALGGAGSPGDILAGTVRGLYRTRRIGAEPWQRLAIPPDRRALTAVAVHPSDPRVILCGAARRVTLAKPGAPLGCDGGLLRSEDAGASWTEIPVRALPVQRGMVSSIAFVPGDPERVFAGTTAGEIFESGDGGRTFRMTTASLPGVLQLALGPSFR